MQAEGTTQSVSSNPPGSAQSSVLSARSFFPRYGWIGVAVIVCEELAILFCRLGVEPRGLWYELAGWATPACWWGYILLVDAWIYRCRAQSLLQNRRPIFWMQCILSVAFWTMFEGYNVLMPAWQYEGLIPYLPLRYLGYIIAFATIMPGMFETTELVQTWGWCRNWKRNDPAGAARETSIPAFWLNLSTVMGLLFCVVPPLLGSTRGPYFWAFVWCGWVFLLDPINYRRGGQSIFGDWARGDFSRFAQLMIAGALCGLLWEFWNYWATTKWVYTFPMLRAMKIFEMPIAGFLGFPPFNVEYFVMFHFIALFFTRQDKLRL